MKHVNKNKSTFFDFKNIFLNKDIVYSFYRGWSGLIVIKCNLQKGSHLKMEKIIQLFPEIKNKEKFVITTSGKLQNNIKISKKYLDILVGNELAIQKRINLSIQLPNDSSSLLPLHADTWSGVSPFETVIWLPLVDCYRTKTMYILPANKVKKYENKFLGKKIKSSQQIFNLIKKDLIWLKVNYGEVLVFDQSLPHGNIVNIEKETRWSMNIRFKGLFTPYGDKKLGEFFEPITLKPISKKGMNYKLPRQ